MSKRKRDPTFTTSEKLTLINVVESHFHIVESKKTDNVTTKNKNNEWRQIEKDFNAISSMFPRNHNVLRNCWENMKKRAKHYLGTGAGPPQKNTEDPCIERVLALIQSRVSEYINVYDSDGTSILASRSCEPKSDSETETISDFNINNTLENIDIEQHHTTQRQLQRAPAAASTSRRRPTLRNIKEVQSPVQSFALKRISTLELANSSHAQEEHDLKIKILKLQEEQESLKVKQEILKLKILEEEYNKIKQR